VKRKKRRKKLLPLRPSHPFLLLGRLIPHGRGGGEEGEKKKNIHSAFLLEKKTKRKEKKEGEKKKEEEERGGSGRPETSVAFFSFTGCALLANLDEREREKGRRPAKRRIALRHIPSFQEKRRLLSSFGSWVIAGGGKEKKGKRRDTQHNQLYSYLT